MHTVTRKAVLARRVLVDFQVTHTALTCMDGARISSFTQRCSVEKFSGPNSLMQSSNAHRVCITSSRLQPLHSKDTCTRRKHRASRVTSRAMPVREATHLESIVVRGTSRKTASTLEVQPARRDSS